MKNSPTPNMKQILLILAVVMGQSVLAAEKKLIADPKLE